MKVGAWRDAGHTQDISRTMLGNYSSFPGDRQEKAVLPVRMRLRTQQTESLDVTTVHS